MSNVTHIFTGSPIDPHIGVLPTPGECLACFVHRMTAAARCSDSLGWAEHYRLVRARRAVSLTKRLCGQGVTCDCAVVTELWRPSIALWRRDEATDDLEPQKELPPCGGVRAGSTKPCPLWVPATSLAQ